MFRLAAVVFVSAALTACQMDPEAEQAEIVDNLIQAGFPQDDIQIYDGQVYVGRDGHVTLDASREMLGDGSHEEQYRTTNLVSLNVKRICINTTSRFTRYARLMAGLDLAIENYNSQGLNFVMVKNGTGCDATIVAKVAGGTGGSAGFPSNGLPYGEINIGSGLNNYSNDVNEHVITHELGHCIGFRHSDYYNRAISCGGAASNEGSSGVGAIHIPGTPTTAVLNGSVMNSCFRSTETGEWSSSDVTALNALY